ncbi:hypothetical protein VE01_03374 [Pseudogymnoascus verrucosus]|uniref:ADP-ribosylation factor GTPase-activating protein n=1 Tax=Pseudogymnoascus verrucosus TaxID=342668 RepID=A0A1B8GS97_9PEZI|nr:uncharacterized protein VE01_03374 [Pseudogymnoascus verrucosus]OBT98695.1 hypothetical protein VE01_03374 [Pseudogymnoascus verrucosus]
MGVTSSKPEDGAALYLRDQSRFSIASLTVTNSKRRVVAHIVPNAYPATKVSASHDASDQSIVEYVQDPDPSPTSGVPNFLLKINNDEELTFTYTLIIRQSQQPSSSGSGSSPEALVDTALNGLTYVSASTAKEVENLVTLEFHADPNLHKNANVQLVGDYATGGSQSVSFDWTWKWRPPKPTEDRGGGWRNCCSFVEYDQRAHRLNTLATFSFWVHNVYYAASDPSSPKQAFALNAPPKLRVPSAQSVDSRQSVLDSKDYEDIPSPILAPADGPPQSSGSGKIELPKVDVLCQRPGEDLSATEDGPLFRATMKSLEQKTGNMRARMKKVIKRAEAAHMAQIECNDAMSGFMEALREASSSNANAVQPALDHYFDKIAKEILLYEKQNTKNLQRIIIDPLSKVYEQDIKKAESKKRDFEEESKEFYSYVSRYLGQRQDTMKDKKRVESDTKYQAKRRNFELKRFDYSSFMQDLHGGRKEQEVLSHLTKYADGQTKNYLTTAKKVEAMLPQLEALSTEVKEADKEFQYMRTEREEKRRNLEMSTVTYVEPETVPQLARPPQSSNGAAGTAQLSDSDIGRADSSASRLRPAVNSNTNQPLSISVTSAPSDGSKPATTPASAPLPSPRESSKFKGIRDLEEKDYSLSSSNERVGTERKEGLLWALSKPGSHVDPKGLNKQSWHKFWIVLDQGKLSEYSNWKEQLDLHMDPIDLRLASVREARNAERRFCFEVITPHYTRVYQSTSQEDMTSWISAINNALQSAMEGRGIQDIVVAPRAPQEGSSIRRDIGSILTGKSGSLGHAAHAAHQSINSSVLNKNDIFRRTTVGARPAYQRKTSAALDESPDKLLQVLREADQGNCWCADCGSGVKTEWVSINLAIIMCIECSGIHRSLGTHISKVRSLTLDITSFTADIVELLLAVGNRISNTIWEARLDASLKPSPQATRDQRLKFITAKYVDRAYVAPLSPTLSRYGTPDETLLAAIKKNEIQSVLYALALRANPNATDKSRATHAVFLALAAADPASPSSSLPPAPPRTADKPKSVAFPVAELLVQNGAEVPAALPAFPLSRAAALYVDVKLGRGEKLGDRIAPLPGVGAGPTGAISSSPAEKERAREARLQKRVSAGGRLARAVIPER